VRVSVDRESGGEQLLYVYSGVVGEFYFRAPVGSTGVPTDPSGKLSLDPNAYYRLVAKHSGKCLDIMAERAILQQYYCLDNAPRQAFRFKLRPDGSYSLLPKEPGNQCLDLFYWIEENGGFLTTWSCHDGLNQAFRLNPAGEGYYKLVPQNSKKCVTIVNASHGVNVLALQWDCIAGPAGAHQQFRIEPWPGK